MLFALALAGCGGGDDDSSTAAAPVETTEAASLTKEELVAQGDAICAEVNAAVGTVGSTSSDAAGQAQQVAGLYGGMAERLKGLGAPSDESAGYAEFIAAAEALSQAEDNVKLAAEREEGESEAESEASSALSAFQSAASEFGLEECAEAPAAPTPGGSGSGEESAGEAETGGIEEGGEEIAPEEVEPAPEEVQPAPETGGGVGGGGTEGGGSGGGSSGGIGPG
ncbi:MAG TPA: hypothetical protein VFT19_01335 [Solirubrobacterales bacterium]|nr:hypothetical protein [Solirubrobacterales bacterium]